MTLQRKQCVCGHYSPGASCFVHKASIGIPIYCTHVRTLVLQSCWYVCVFVHVSTVCDAPVLPPSDTSTDYTWEVPLPFTISPSSGTLVPKATGKMEVTFSPEASYWSVTEAHSFIQGKSPVFSVLNDVCTHTYVYMHIRTYVYMHIRTYVYMHIRMYTCTYVHMYTCTYVHMYTCPYVCIHAHTYVYMRIHTYVYMRIHTYVYLRIL